MGAWIYFTTLAGVSALVLLAWLRANKVVRSRAESLVQHSGSRLPLAECLTTLSQRYDGVLKGTSASLKHRDHTVKFYASIEPEQTDGVLNASIAGAPTKPIYPARFVPINDDPGPPLNTTHMPSIRLRRENAVDRLGKRLRINRELHTGDGLFDPNVYVESDAPDSVVHRLLERPQVRRGVMLLLDAGFNEVEFFGNAVPVYASSQSTEPIHPDVAAKVVDALVDIVSGLPPVATKDVSGFYSARGWEATVWSALLALLGFGFCVVCFAWMDLYPTLAPGPESVSGLAGALLWVGSCAASVAILRGSSTALRSIFWTAVFMAVACPLWSYGSLRMANGLLDTSEPRQVTAKIIESKATKGEYDGPYQVTLQVDGHPDTRLDVDASTYFQLPRKGEQTQIVLRSGRLWWPWIESLTVPEPIVPLDLDLGVDLGTLEKPEP